MPKEPKVNLIYAVDRLYETGWLVETAAEPADCDRLSDGRRFPTVSAVRREFERAGLKLSIKQNLAFNCYRAEWAAAGQPFNGTVVASCEKEAAVYALAQLRQARAEHQLVSVAEAGGVQFAPAG